VIASFPRTGRGWLAFLRAELLSCVFPITVVLGLALSKLLPLPIPRYDFLLLWCLLVQVLMVYFKKETVDELKVICVFHIVGLILELFKTYKGSWSYPDIAYTKVLGRVPLYSGFMYASVASYICQAWRRLQITLHDAPRGRWDVLLATLIYINFFTHQLGLYDLRWFLVAAVIGLYFKTYVLYRVAGEVRKMPMAFAFLCMGLAVYAAENVATYFGAWKYPNQHNGWQLVHISKISSWFLLIILSFLLVAFLKRVKGRGSWLVPGG
jgi:uncharacterized membrane protein YoaT (DUF817 family)